MDAGAGAGETVGMGLTAAVDAAVVAARGTGEGADDTGVVVRAEVGAEVGAVAKQDGRTEMRLGAAVVAGLDTTAGTQESASHGPRCPRPIAEYVCSLEKPPRVVHPQLDRAQGNSFEARPLALDLDRESMVDEELEVQPSC